MSNRTFFSYSMQNLRFPPWWSSLILLAASFAPLAHAGTVSLEGGLLPGTCQLESIDEVRFPDLHVQDIEAVIDGRVSGSESAFHIRFSRCVGVAGVQISFSGAPVPGRSLYLNTGDASGVALELVDDHGASSMPAEGYTRSVPLGSGSAIEFSGKAYYFRLGNEPVGGTLVEANSTVSMDYY